MVQDRLARSPSPVLSFSAPPTANSLRPMGKWAGPARETGVFPKIEKNGWTGIALVNTEASAASVTLTAYNDTGAVVATYTLPPIGGHAKWVNLAEAYPLLRGYQQRHLHCLLVGQKSRGVSSPTAAQT